VVDRPETASADTADTADNGNTAESNAPRSRRRITVLGDYQLGEKLGSGAMGAVYRARRISTGRPAAVKVLRVHLAKNRLFLQRFLREAQVMARLSHPNIVRCYGMGKKYGRHYLAMELVEGASLGDWLHRLGRLSVGDAIHVALAVARGLQHAHQNGLVHRDVKPDNILITRDGEIKLVDLGLAKGVLEEDTSATQTGQGAGTPVYMAPEQARSARDVDPRSDLYALGCVLYQMLTGQFPFRAGSSLEVILAKIDGGYSPAAALNAEVPACLDAVLALLLAPHPDDRYQSATDLINEVEELGLANVTPHFIQDHGDFLRVTPATTPTDLATVPEEKRWYVLFRTAEGKWTTSRYSTSEVIAALDDRHFAATAQASATRGDYRLLSDFPEFKTALAALADRSKVLTDGDQLAELQSTAEMSQARPDRKNWSRRLLLAALFLAVGGVGFWLGQMLVR
jgi:serine/threonine-protein kinase